MKLPKFNVMFVHAQLRVLGTIAFVCICGRIAASNIAHNVEVKHDSCGDNLIWELLYNGDTTILHISGTGEMDNYDCSQLYAPWFSDAMKIHATSIDDGATSIGNYAFAWCEKMDSISIPNSIIEIGEHAFHECDRLTSIVLPENLETINDYTFVWCDHMPKIDIPENVESIGIGAFTGCTALNTIIIPQGTSYIDLSAFSWCTNLKYLSIGENATNIRAFAFAWCENLKTILNYSPIPQIIGEDVFQGLKRSSCMLYVPSGAMELYKNTFVWKDFIIRDIADAPKPNPTEGTELIYSNASSDICKILINGQVFILRGDKIYSITGAEVK